MSTIELTPELKALLDAARALDERSGAGTAHLVSAALAFKSADAKRAKKSKPVIDPHGQAWHVGDRVQHRASGDMALVQRVELLGSGEVLLHGMLLPGDPIYDIHKDQCPVWNSKDVIRLEDPKHARRGP